MPQQLKPPHPHFTCWVLLHHCKHQLFLFFHGTIQLIVLKFCVCNLSSARHSCVTHQLSSAPSVSSGSIFTSTFSCSYSFIMSSLLSFSILVTSPQVTLVGTDKISNPGCLLPILLVVHHSSWVHPVQHYWLHIPLQAQLTYLMPLLGCWGKVPDYLAESIFCALCSCQIHTPLPFCFQNLLYSFYSSIFDSHHFHLLNHCFSDWHICEFPLRYLLPSHERQQLVAPLQVSSWSHTDCQVCPWFLRVCDVWVNTHRTIWSKCIQLDLRYQLLWAPFFGDTRLNGKRVQPHHTELQQLYHH